MIEVPTVLVVGAGSSKEYDYPTGPELRDIILDGLADSNSKIHRQLTRQLYDDSAIKAFRSTFADSQLPTIDQFLEGHSDFAPMGKLAIACALIPYEQREKLERRSKRPTWYDYLWDELRQDIDNFTDNKLTIVTFNYDRSLEQYLGRALEVAGATDISERLSSLGFIHVYGTLGPRPYVDPVPRPYSDTDDLNALQEAAADIRIINREDDDELLSQFKLARNALSEAKRVVMLGFGYEAKNVERLGLRLSVEGRHAGVLGTAWKIPAMQLETVKEVVGLQHQLRLEEVTCVGMFEKHFRFK